MRLIMCNARNRWSGMAGLQSGNKIWEDWVRTSLNAMVNLRYCMTLKFEWTKCQGHKSGNTIWEDPLRTNLDAKVYLHVLHVTILRSVVLDDGASCAGDLKSGSVLSSGSIISKRPHVFECIHVTCALEHNPRMIRLYRTSTVSENMSNANWATLIVKLYTVTMNNRNTECK